MARVFYREGDAIPRLRSMFAAFPLTEGEKAGPVLAALAKPHVKQVTKAFSTEGASTAQGAWKPLSARYAIWKRLRVGALGILVFTKAFRKVATTLGLITRVYEPPNTYGLGYTDEVGARHEAGGKRLPRRSVLDKTPSDVQEIMAAFQTFWIDRAKAIIRAGGGRIARPPKEAP